MMLRWLRLISWTRLGRDGVEKEFRDRGIAEASGNRLLDFFVELNSLDHAAELAAGENTARQSSKR